MMDFQNIDLIAELIGKELTGSISPSQKIALDEWVKESPANEALYNKYRSVESFKQTHTSRATFPKEFVLKRIEQSIKRRQTIKWSAVAAVLVALLAIPSLSIYNRTNMDDLQAMAFNPDETVLILADGSEVKLSDQSSDTIGNVAVVNGAQLDYSQSDADTKETMFNELKVPAGRSFVVILGDGTKVWLNAQSSLRYPIKFSGKERKVILEGEAYFEVTKNKKAPFIVETRDNMSVEVLGTSFNVKSYRDQNDIETVLAEGSVKVNSSIGSTTLVPGNKSSYDPKTKQIEVTEVDAGDYTSWRNGRFVFRGERIEDIFKQLARWYGISVVYRDNTAKEILFSGNLERYDNIVTLLEAMEAAGGVSFRYDGKHIVISSL